MKIKVLEIIFSFFVNFLILSFYDLAIMISGEEKNYSVLVLLNLCGCDKNVLMINV